MPNRRCISFRQKDKSLKCLWYYRSVLHSHEDKTQRTFSLKLLSEMDPSSASDVNTQQKLMQCIDYSEWKQKSLTSAITTACNFPVDQAQSIDISTFKRVKVSHVDSLIQHLWSHVPIKTITHRVKKKWQNVSERQDDQLLQEFMVTQTSWCQPFDWVQCQWCLWQSHAGQPSPGLRWHRCSSSSPGCSWTWGLCGRCLAFLYQKMIPCSNCLTC